MFQLTLQERISERIVVLFVVVSRIRVGNLKSSLEANCRLSQTMETFPYHRSWKNSWKKFSLKRWLVVGPVKVEDYSIVSQGSVEGVVAHNWHNCRFGRTLRRSSPCRGNFAC